MKQKNWKYCCVVLCLVNSTAAQALPGWSSANKTKHPASEDVALIRGGDLNYRIVGTGGIKVSMPHTLGWMVRAGDTYEVFIDGSALSASSGFPAQNVAADFAAAPGQSYFVSAKATCALPSAALAAGKEILVCNKIPDGSITYATVDGQTISGQASGALTNSTLYKIDRFISDGFNWFKE